MNSKLIIISMFYYLIIIYMKFSKVLEYLKDIRVLSILLIVIFILGFIYSKCIEGMTVSQLEQQRKDFDKSIHDASFNELTDEKKRAAATASDNKLTKPIAPSMPSVPSMPSKKTEPTEAEKRAESNAIDGKLSTICPEGCKQSCPNADLKCLQSMHPRCVNCEAKIPVGEHKIVGNIGDSNQEMPVINININTENSKDLSGSVPTPFSALESYNISKKGQLTDDTASNTNNMFGSNKNPSNIRSSDVTPKSSTGMINTSQVEIDNK